MKIENNHSHGLPRHVSRPMDPAAEASFKSQFTQALDASAPNRNPSAAITATRSPAALAPLNGFARQGAVHSFENFLSALDTYRERLGDGRFTLKMLEQDLNRIGAQCRQLDPWIRDPRVDEGLRALLKEGLATARVEMERFYRADYC